MLASVGLARNNQVIINADDWCGDDSLVSGLSSELVREGITCMTTSCKQTFLPTRTYTEPFNKDRNFQKFPHRSIKS